jgi:phospholipid/cholesterol/gamma-HCH transport system substrate-binding protein
VSKRVLVNLVVFGGVFAVLVWWSIGNVVSVDAIDRPYEITAEFKAASGILPRAEVAYLGVHAGDVKHVDRVPGGVRMTLQLDRDRHIPAGSIARIFRKSAVGEPYIDFVPPTGYEGDHGPFLEPGDVVPVEKTTNPLELSELLRSASRLIEGIEPERLQVLVHELALALHERGDDLRTLTTSSDQLAAELAERTDVLDRLATNNTRLTHTVTEHRQALGSALTSLSQLAESLKNVKGDTSVLLDRGAQLLTEAGDLVGEKKAELDCILTDLEHLTDVAATPEAIADLRRTLAVGPDGYGKAWASRDVIDGDVWVRVGLIADPTPPSQQYVPPLPVPKVPPIAACASTLQPRTVAAAGSSPRPAPTPSPRVLAATMGGMPLLLGFLVLRVVRRSAS